MTAIGRPETDIGTGDHERHAMLSVRLGDRGKENARRNGE